MLGGFIFLAIFVNIILMCDMNEYSKTDVEPLTRF